MTAADQEPGRLAVVDEAVGERWYVLVAVVLERERQPELRRLAATMLLPQQRRVHWHDESAARREKLATIVADSGCVAIVVVATPVDNKRQDRARRHSLERLVWELAGLGVAKVVAESRQPVRDRADTRALAGFRRRGSMPPTMTFEHARPLDESLLWLADVVAGAVLADRRGTTGYRKLLSEMIIEIGIAVT
jgi:hypothetical protein